MSSSCGMVSTAATSLSTHSSGVALITHTSRAECRFLTPGIHIPGRILAWMDACALATWQTGATRSDSVAAPFNLEFSVAILREWSAKEKSVQVWHAHAARFTTCWVTKGVGLRYLINRKAHWVGVNSNQDTPYLVCELFFAALLPVFAYELPVVN